MSSSPSPSRKSQSKIQWVKEVPPAGVGNTAWNKGQSMWNPIAEEIKQHPNEWALIGKQINANAQTWFRKAGFRVTTRNNKKLTNPSNRQVCDVYVMWVEDVS